MTAILILLGSVLTAAPGAEARYAALVMRADTGEVLFARNADDRLYPASLVKMMTLYLTFEALEDGRLTLDTPITASRRAAGQTPNKLYLDAGDSLTVNQAINATIVMSGNDVATMLAESITGSEIAFARLMTQRARDLGMHRTNFTNATGLPSRRQVSTARDMATLAQALIQDFPQYYDRFSRPSFTYRGRSYSNHNKLLGDYPGLDGLKTGYIRASGFNLVASAERNGVRLIGVVFGGRSQESRDAHMVEILDQAFARIGGQTLANSGLPASPPEPPQVHPRYRQLASIPTPQRHPQAGQPGAVTVAADDHAIGSRGGSDAGAAWSVQVGAYSSQEQAAAALDAVRQRHTGLVTGLERYISPSHHEGERLFQARLGPIPGTRARALCRQLTEQGQDCLAVSLDQ